MLLGIESLVVVAREEIHKTLSHYVYGNEAQNVASLKWTKKLELCLSCFSLVTLEISSPDSYGSEKQENSAGRRIPEAIGTKRTWKNSVALCSILQ